MAYWLPSSDLPPRPAPETTCRGQAWSRGPTVCSLFGREPTPSQSPGTLPPPRPPLPGAPRESIFSDLPSPADGVGPGPALLPELCSRRPLTADDSVTLPG